VNRRLDADVAAGGAPFQGAWLAVRQWPGALRTVGLHARGRPEAWPAMLTALGAAHRQARVHGVSEREVQAARVAFLTAAKDAERRDSTAPLRSVLREINDAVTRDEPVLSAAQHVALLEQLLPGLTAAEVSVALAAMLDPGDIVVVAEVPADARPPAQAELVAQGRAALDVTATARADRESPAALLADPPARGAVVESRRDAPSAVTSFWLDNGVRGHHRLMEQERGTVIVTLTLAGGAIEEQAGDRGITEAAAQAWARPATRRFGSTVIRDFLAATTVRVASHVGEDALQLTLRSSPGDLEVAFQLAYLLLTEPMVEPPALARWKDSYAEWIAARRREPMQALRAITPHVLFPADDPRPRALELAEVRAIQPSAAQAWLGRLVAAAPIEMAVVGEVNAAAALDLAARYVGALPSRARIDDKTLADARTLRRLPGPIAVARTIETRTPQAAVLSGFFGADARDLRDARLLGLASRVLSTRMRRSLREERQLVYSIGVVSHPAQAYPGLGMVTAQAPTDPGRARALAEAIDEMFARFAAEGPTETEMAVSRRQIAQVIEEEMERPEFWASRLSALDYRSLRLADLLTMRQAYERFTAAEVRDAVRRYRTPDARFTIIVSPQ
jgi:zinc protease